MLVFVQVNAQSSRRTRAVEINFERYDELIDPEKRHKRRHYGFQLGVFNSQMVINTSGKFGLDGDTLVRVSAPATTGFLLGFIFNVKLNDELWNLRLLPNVSFYDRQMRYDFTTRKTETQSAEVAMFEMPVMVKYQAVRRLNSRFYIGGGLNLATQVGGKRDDPRFLSYNRENAEVIYAVGADLYFRYFKFAPELRFAHGLGNMLRPANNLYSQSLDRLTTHRVALVLNFE